MEKYMKKHTEKYMDRHMEIMKQLLEKREKLQNGNPDIRKWAKERGLSYAFSEEGYLLAACRKEVCLTQDGNAVWPFLRDGTPRENLSEKKQERMVLIFTGPKTAFQTEVPLPCGFSVKEIICQDHVFTIRSDSGQGDLAGTFPVMREALTLAESLYCSEKGVSEETLLKCCYEYLTEDHQNYLKKAEQEKLFLSGRNNRTAKADNFYRNENGDYVCNFTAELWGDRAEIYAVCSEKSGQTNKMRSKLSKHLNSHIQWIHEQKKQIQKAVLDEDMVSLACEWMEEYERTGENGKSCYELEDGSLLPAPVTEELFLSSLHIGGIHAYCEENKITFELFLDTEPDFFACHSIEVFITAAPERTYRIKVNGLAG